MTLYDSKHHRHVYQLQCILTMLEFDEMKKIKKLDLSELQKNYFAGFFDAKGYVGSFRADGRLNYRVQISNTNKPLLEHFLVFGGGVSKRSGETLTQEYAWTLNGKRIILRFILALYWKMNNEKKKAKLKAIVLDNISYLRESDQKYFKPLGKISEE